MKKYIQTLNNEHLSGIILERKSRTDWVISSHR